MSGNGTFEGGESPAANGTRSRRGAFAAAAALVVVLAAAYFGYQALGNAAEDVAQVPGTSGASASAGAAPSAGTGPSERAGASTGASESPEADAAGALMLSDFDSTVYTEYGDARKLTQIADGKPLVMNFWATWCPYCVQEMDDYQGIYDDYSDRVSFAFIDCADGVRETVEQGAGWLYDNEYTLPAYFDTRQEAQYAFGASALPTTVVVSAGGEILTVSAGAIDPALMRSALDSLLEA